MLLIKYFSNTKAVCLWNTGIPSRGVTTTKTSIAGNGRSAQGQLQETCALGSPGNHLYRLMVGLWYMHM